MGVCLLDQQTNDIVFSVNFWHYRAIVEAVRSLRVLPEATVDSLHQNWTGSGLTTEEARLVAKAIRSQLLPTLAHDERLLFDGWRTVEQDDGTMHWDAALGRRRTTKELQHKSSRARRVRCLLRIVQRLHSLLIAAVAECRQTPRWSGRVRDKVQSSYIGVRAAQLNCQATMNGIAKRALVSVFSRLFAGLAVGVLFAPPAFPQSQSQAKTMYIIDYAHESGGVLHHGTLSMIDGTVRVTWTIDEDGKRKSRDVSMSEEAFRRAWEALNGVPEFRTAIADSNVPLNFVTHHIVGIVFRVSGQEEMRTFAISTSSPSAAFQAWLAQIRETEK